MYFRQSTLRTEPAWYTEVRIWYLFQAKGRCLNKPSTDISFGNVTFMCDVALNGDEDVFVALGGQPITATYTGQEALPASMPRMLVKTADWDMWTDRDEEDIRLLDWGLAFPVGQIVTTLPQPIDLRSPETFFCASIDSRHDLWRAGCVVRPFSHLLTEAKANQPIPHRSTPCIFSNHHFRSSTALTVLLLGKWCQSSVHYQHHGICCGGICKGEAWTLKSTVSREISALKSQIIADEVNCIHRPPSK